jgi:hypothetical protein
MTLRSAAAGRNLTSWIRYIVPVYLLKRRAPSTSPNHQLCASPPPNSMPPPSYIHTGDSGEEILVPSRLHVVMPPRLALSQHPPELMRAPDNENVMNGRDVA